MDTENKKKQKDGESRPLEALVRVQWPEEKAPLEINAKCPICGGGLLLDAGDGLVKADNGDWVANEVDLRCKNAPDIDSDEWEEWFEWHYRMPYVDWLPLETKILKQVQRKFYFAP